MADRQEQAEQDYLSGMKYKDIADKYEVSINTVKSWKQRNGWTRDGTKKGAHKKQKGAPLNNQYAKGNKGGPPERNKNAVTHGLFAKWLPGETKEIMEILQDRTEADMLWDSIMFQYTAILRSQKIMFVANQDDTTKEQTQYGFGEAGSDKYEYQYAWDKQAAFLSAQSRALGTLSNLIKQFSNLVDDRDERAQKLKLMKANVKLLDLKAKEQEYDDEVEDDGFIQALENEAGDLTWEE
ncbi:TerS [Marinilactibacillus psychrotolerans]|uniref:TerS n=1 Tax=Marinilactibacillus psychrotolerans TaxID=191770 RepID=A0A5R9C6R4_9LACT|nr:phage terminase small subunit [Marinilactibacillus psychrotolerans]TLQ08823.1 TerS [Marinilactibacillus psychrotolerans]